MSFLEEESTLLSFDIAGLGEYLDVGSLRGFQYGVQGRRMGVATPRHLLVLQGSPQTRSAPRGSSPVPAPGAGSLADADWDPGHEEQRHIQIAGFVPEHGYPLCLQWLASGVLAVGFDSGYLVCFDESASTISENRFGDSALVSMQLDSSAGAGAAVVVWLLFEKGNCVSVSIIDTCMCNTSFSSYRLFFFATIR
jgi:hypothetical protein